MLGVDVGSITLADLAASHHEVLAELRSAGPVAWVPALGAWVVTGREVAREVLRDADRFTVDDPRFSTAQVVGPSMLSLDGDEHRRHRGPFVAAFRPADVTARFGPAIDREARALVGRLAPAGRGELRTAIAGPLAAYVAGAALGLDRIGPDVLLSWYREIVAATERVSLGGDAGDEAARAVASLRAAVQEAAADPGTAVAAVRAQLADEELASNAAVFLFGGIETTEGMIANLLHHLLGDADTLHAVREDRALLGAAIEESLRLDPAVAQVDRYATRDTELGGRSIAAGDFVAVSLSAANRDPAVYAEPDRFDIGRVGEPGHLAFVQGPHACIGAHLARLETAAAVGAVLDLLPGITLDAEHDPVVDGVVFRKVGALWATW